MRAHYHEILAAFSPREPLWFDESAVPRFVPFTPRETANIYAYEAMLQEVACQNCGRRFSVALSRCSMSDARARRLVSWLEAPPHYGDPPNVACCGAGPSMNVELIRVVEHWKKRGFDWHRLEPA